jgi:predicted AAA+ superfamily ATPase
MNLVLKDLKKEKNKILCLIEDILFDSIVNLMGDNQDKAVENFTSELIGSVKTNAVDIAVLCYTDNGRELTKEDLKDQPIKIRLMQECLPIIMEIFTDSVHDMGDQNETVKKKKMTIRKKTKI